MPKIEKTPAEQALSNYKKFAIKAVRDFGYPSDVENQIKKARSESEVEHLMVTARKKYWGDE